VCQRRVVRARDRDFACGACGFGFHRHLAFRMRTISSA
jgi:hypothetical protein